MTISSIEELQDKLDSDFSWRAKEILSLKLALSKKSVLNKDTLIRASVPILYAHWEAFVKNSSTFYLEFINTQCHTYKELKPCFIVFGVKRKVDELTNSKKSKSNIEIIKFLSSELHETAKLKTKSAIRTDSNLSSSVFENIAFSVDIDTKKYESKYNLIDKQLLDKRNNIAHGKFLTLDETTFNSLIQEILALLRQYKEDIEYAASGQHYIAP